MRHTILICLALWSAILSAQLPLPTGGPQITPVEQAFRWDMDIESPNRLTVHFDIDSCCYLYSDAIAVTTTAGKPLFIEMPEGQWIEDEHFGRTMVFDKPTTVQVTHSYTPPLALTLHFQGCAHSGFCYPPQRIDFTLLTSDWHTGHIEAPTTPTAFQKPFYLILLGFLGAGILLSFTPCVLPMIPILSNIIVGQNTHRAFRLTLIYVLSMACTYALAGLLAAYLGYTLQAALQRPDIIFSFSALLCLLAAKQLDWIKLSLPGLSSLSNLQQNQSGGSTGRVILLGFLATLIASPCVSAPLLGALAYIAQTGDMVLGATALFSMGLGLGLPLLVLGTLGGRYLPKAGPWLTRINQLFALLLVSLAIWLATPFISATVQLIFWGMLAALAGYLFDGYRLQAPGFIPRLGMLCFLGALALWGYAAAIQVPDTNHTITTENHIVVRTPTALDSALQQAQIEHKPILLDFYADWCVTCQKIKKHILTQDSVRDALSNWRHITIDVTENNEQTRTLLRRYQVPAPPVFIFMDENTHIRDMLSGGDITATHIIQKTQY